MVAAPPPPARSSAVMCQMCCKAEYECGEEFKLCGQCRLSHYCSRDCQRRHWRVHKARCRANAQAMAMEEEALSPAAVREINAWIKRNRALLTCVAAGHLCSNLGITSPANCKQDLLNKATLNLAVQYRKDGTMRIDLDNAPPVTLAAKEAILTREASQKEALLGRDRRMVYALVTFGVEGRTGPAGPDPMVRLLPLGFEVHLVEEYLEKKAKFQQALYLDIFKDE